LKNIQKSPVYHIISYNNISPN